MEEHACERTWEGFRAYDLRHGCVRTKKLCLTVTKPLCF